MYKHEKMLQIRDAAQFIFNGMMSGCVEMSVAAKEAYLELVDQFYSENSDLMAPAQYDACKKDYDYFMSLIDLAVEHHRHI